MLCYVECGIYAGCLRDTKLVPELVLKAGRPPSCCEQAGMFWLFAAKNMCRGSCRWNQNEAMC